MTVWVDMDGGFDDIWAVLTLQRFGVKISGMSLVAGNAPFFQVSRNAAGAAETFGWNFPIYAGNDRPLFGKPTTAERVLGPVAIRSAGLRLPDFPEHPIGEGGLDALNCWLTTGKRKQTILALGPLTNIASIALARPESILAVSSIVWMGGGTSGGNHTAAAEFNAFADLDALAVLLGIGAPISIVDLDVCRSVQFDKSDIVPIAESAGENADLLADLAAGYLSIALDRNRTSMAIYDPVAAVALARPQLFGFRRANVEVAFDGREGGRTNVSFAAAGQQYDALIACNPNIEAVKGICLAALLKEADR